MYHMLDIWSVLFNQLYMLEIAVYTRLVCLNLFEALILPLAAVKF